MCFLKMYLIAPVPRYWLDMAPKTSWIMSYFYTFVCMCVRTRMSAYTLKSPEIKTEWNVHFYSYIMQRVLQMEFDKQ
jgi:hypothetical protein